jgi:8-oxo-dGTP pyrophosphatase MutT (NUDIX family)
MKRIAQVLLFDRDRKLLIYLRDDKPDIPFPNHWDFFGGHVEEGETPEERLKKSWASSLRNGNSSRAMNAPREMFIPILNTSIARTSTSGRRSLFFPKDKN